MKSEKDVSFSAADIRNFTDSDFSYFYSYISDERRKKADSYPVTNVNGKKLSILASFQLERLLESAGLERPFSYITLPSGKPAISGNALSFSLSHSGNFAAAAVSPFFGIGVDIEDINLSRKAEAIDDISRRFFMPEEQRLLALAKQDEIEKKLLGRDGENEYKETFLRIWTMKEACMKATEKPLITVFKEVPFSPGDKALTEKHTSETVLAIYRAARTNS